MYVTLYITSNFLFCIYVILLLKNWLATNMHIFIFSLNDHKVQKELKRVLGHQKGRQRSSLLVGWRNWFNSMPWRPFSARMVWRKGCFEEKDASFSQGFYNMCPDQSCFDADPGSIFHLNADPLCSSLYRFYSYSIKCKILSLQIVYRRLEDEYEIMFIWSRSLLL